MKNGYLVYNVTCEFTLLRILSWDKVDTSYYQGGYVFSEQEIEKLRKSNALNWENPPAYIQRASWDEDKGTIVTGSLEPLWINQ